MPHSAANFHKWFQVLLRGLRGCAVENWNVHEFNPITDLSISAHFPFAFVRAAAFPSFFFGFLFELQHFLFLFFELLLYLKALYLVASRQKSRRDLHSPHHLCFSLWSSNSPWSSSTSPSPSSILNGSLFNHSCPWYLPTTLYRMVGSKINWV